MARTRDAFAETQEGSEAWNDLSQEFFRELKSLRPVRVVDEVLLLEQKPASVEVLQHPESEGVAKEVNIEVYLRSAKPKEVAELYSQALSRHNIPFAWSSKGATKWGFSDHFLTITVDPGDEITPERARMLSRRRRQPTFPPPQLIGEDCKSRLGSVDKRKPRGFAYFLGESPGPGAKAENLIKACTAWYAADRGWMIENPKMRPELARLLNQHLLIPCGREPLPEDSWSSTDAVWRDAKKVSQSLVRLESILHNRSALNTYF